MATHSLPRGNELIEGLTRLGLALGYAAEKERPVERGRSNPPAVDVAWLSEEGQDYPLMIFEIESRATNAAANNPVKVFGQTTERFEKPLFFFHVFISSGQETTRIENLRQLFGTYNYRAYEMDKGGAGELLKDVLSQHRRLRRRLELSPLLDELNTDVWRHKDIVDLLRHIEGLGFSADFLSEYAARARVDPRYRLEHLRLLGRELRLPVSDRSAGGYETYIGRIWSEPIHIGLLALPDPDQEDWLTRLRDWQERSSYMSRIGPHFELSADYDDFVLGLAPVLWALTGALMYRVIGAREYIFDQLLVVLERLGRAAPEDSFFSAVWAVHIAAAAGDESRYSRARSFINDRNGISPETLLHPPSMVNIGERSEEWTQTIAHHREPVPSLSVFRGILSSRYGTIPELDDGVVGTALDVLTRDTAIYEWAAPVALLLHASGSFVAGAVSASLTRSS